MSIRRAQDERIEGTPDGLTAVTEISDIPDAPTIGTATAGVESATVTYTAAATGGAVTTFTATSSPGSVTGTGASPITVSGLTASTAYTFTVIGSNSTGTSPASAASNSVTPTAATSFESIATATVGVGGQNSIEFTSIPQTYSHLQLRGLSRSPDASNLIIQFNNNTSAVYSFHALATNGTNTLYPQATINSTFANFASSNYSAAAANLLAPSICDIFDYTNTNKFKTFRTLTGIDTNQTAGQGVNLISGNWRSTSAITSIKIQGTSPPFSQYTTFALYGIKG